MKKHRWLAVLLTFMLASCTGVQAPVISPTTSSTKTVSPIPSQIPFVQRQPTKTINSTPPLHNLPILSPSEAERKTIELLKNNGGCRLPCFWNLIPGETRVQTVHTFLNEFQNIRHNVLFAELGGGSDLQILREQTILTTQITVEGHRDTHSDVVRWISVDMQAYQEKQNVQEPIYDDPYYAQYFQYYSLPNLLSTYGPPENVYIGIELAAQMGGLDQYYIALDYSKSGWTALITMAASQKEGSIYMACPKWGGFTSLRLWQSGEGGIPGLAPFTLEEATKLDLETFYQQFKEPTTLCLETDVDLLNFPK